MPCGEVQEFKPKKSMAEFNCERKSVLVTGATGFVASHLLPVLSQQGWLIVAAVRDRSRQLLGANKIAVVGEIDGCTDWRKVLEGVDAVIHLAARAHILHETLANPEAEFLRVNTDGTANLARQSRETGVKQFIFISSIGAMATLSGRPLSEKSSCQPDTPYGRSKLLAERALIEHTNSAMAWTILRPTLVYARQSRQYGALDEANRSRLAAAVWWPS